jgi:hypothetical protein
MTKQVGRRLRVVSVALFLAGAALSASPNARADASDEAIAPSAADRGAWYGWQTLIADGLAAGGMVSAFAVNKDGAYVFLGGLGVYALAPPIVHAAHGYLARGAVDLGLRLGSVVGGGILGGGVGLTIAIVTPTCGGSRSDFCGLGLTAFGGLLGMGAGIVAASAIDAIFFAWEGRPNEPSTPATPTAFRVTPVVAPTKGGMVGGLGGTF